MLKPSYSDLMDILNKDNDVDSKITSRYTIVIAAAKRARQLIDGADPLTYAPTDRAVSTAVKEMSEGMIKVKFAEDAGYNVINTGMAYTDYESSFDENVYLNSKPIGYAIDKGNREDMLDYDDDERVDTDYRADDAGDYNQEEDLDYEDSGAVTAELPSEQNYDGADR